ncbi:hypothetical protein CANARDRAFT_174089 [[Candida] arabinofermentans NRRL YB-2248]|uniref:uroporphyrinogen-III C-methyltransferase n=1 Tax=[Candida] arabinofermentans NRRL YB-2248 TaxID=983967 RepID=A0A1E4T931_9ASCO|nr:hypothetical protein CANARDRAFT_174089 [[Candida] arabinofermentans NRRL YB-2248]
MENVLEVEDNFNVNNNDLNLKKSRWLSQIIEYYPINKLSKICISDLSDSYKVENDTFNEKEEVVDKKKGTISLIGSGPGSISMLTIGALNEIYNADLILADKLIPQQILDIIPKNTELFIARKFPGNADNAQQELLNLGLLNLQKGKRIVRLKQGDPFIFGRGGEEYLFFNDNGFKPLILPGLTSALVAPIVSSIPTTHRDVIDQVLICTGVGKNGKLGSFPKFKSNRTVIFLMSLKKIADILPELLKKGWFENLAVCIVEKASCPDQRIIRTTLGCLIDVVEIVGIRPPSLLITGNSCDLLCKLPPNEKYKVEEGYNETLQQFDHGLNDIIKNLSGGLV